MRLFSIFVSFCNAQYYSPYKIDNNDATGVVNVTLKEGTIFGLSFGDFDVYRGVPYGQAARFEMATPIVDLKNFNATYWGPTCFQSPGWFSAEPLMDRTKTIGDFVNEGLIAEDCLTFDLYLPSAAKRTNNMGVLFWIHGGGFSSGDSRMYSGIEHAMQEGNAVVVVQYRLGVLGFFNAFDSTSNKTLGGNYGLGDIALALEFIHSNAEKFGANSSHIVVNGESAGSAATMALLMHEPSVNRMAGVVAQSGGTVMNFLSTEKPNRFMSGTPSINAVTMAICKELPNCDYTQPLAIQINALKNASSLDLWNANSKVTGMESAFLPVPNDGQFYKEDMKEKYLSGNVQTKVPMILGWNSFEGSLLMDFMGMLPATARPQDVLAFGDGFLKIGAMYDMFNRIFGTSFNLEDQYKKVVEEFQAYAQIDDLDLEHHKFLVSQFAGDSGLQGQAYMDAVQYSKAGASVYLYAFDFDGAPEQFAMSTKYGLSHAGELIYTFGSFRKENKFRRNWDEELSSFFHSSVNALMRGETGKLWKPFSLQNQAYMDVTNDDNKLILSEELNPPQKRSKRAIEMWKQWAMKDVTPATDNIWAQIFVTIFANILNIILPILGLFMEF